MADYDDGQQRSPFLVPPLPEEVIRNSRTTDKRTGGGTEKVVETAERKGVRDDIDTLEADHQRAMDAKLAHDEATSLINSQHADAALALQDRQIADRDKAYKATQVGIDEWRGRLRESMDRYDKAPAPKLWAEGATDNLLKGIGLALAGIGDAVTTRALITAGHAPTGKNTVADLIEGELARQRANIARLSDRVVTAHAGLADANAARAQLLAEVDQRGSVLFKRADLVAQSRLAGQGMDAAKVQATLDQLGWRQKALEMKEASVAPLIDRVTANHSNAVGTEHSRTENINKPKAGASQIPTHITDLLTGKDLPVDPTATDQRQHNLAVGKLSPINTFVDTANKLIAAADANGPARNELIAKVFGGEGGEQPQADRSAAIVRLRSAYAAAKGESIGEGNSKHLAEAIPEPPSNLAPDGAWQAWKTKIKAVNEEMHQLRKENLAAAGVPRTHLDAPEPSAAKPAPHAAPPPAASPAPPGPPPPPPSDRDEVIRNLRLNPKSKYRARLMQLHNITDKELAQ